MAEFKLDTKFVNCFLEATVSTLKMQCNLPSKPGKPFMKGKGPTAVVALAGVIGITSPKFSGSIALCFPKAVFLGIMEGMLGEKYDVVTKELEDGAGELLNIIYGYAKRTLNQAGYDLSRAIPAVITGNELQIKHMTDGPTIVVPFETESGSFQVEISINSPH